MSLFNNIKEEDNNMENLVYVDNNQLVVSSRSIAEHFEKAHKHILESIEKLKAENSALTSMFYETTYKAGTGKSYKEYLLNRDGFSLLVMGFTGKKALDWKLRYIEAFNQMESQLKNQRPIVPALPKEELELRTREVTTKQAELWMRLADRTNIPEFKQVADTYAVNTLAGKEIVALPIVEKKTYSATEIGKILGISANKVGKLANRYQLKTDVYGKWFYDKSKYSNREVESFRYYENAIDMFRKLMN